MTETSQGTSPGSRARLRPIAPVSEQPLSQSAERSTHLHPAVERPLLLCLSHLRWDFVFQRPQHLMTRAAAAHEVIFFEEPVHDQEGTARLALSTRPGGVTVAVPHLPGGLSPAASDAALRSLLDALLRTRHADRRPLVAWFYTPMAFGFAGHLQPDVTVYDCMDELSAFRGAPPAMLEMEQRLLSRADLVFTGGRSLYEAKRGRHPQVHCFPSSIDAAHFRAARRSQQDPADQAAIPRPRIGFFGVVDERMDTGLVGQLAEMRPEWQFVMVGPVVKIDPATLPRRPNIHWLGSKRYAELPQILAGWDAGFMPFALNESTRFISPTKTPEFLAAGLPVVSTAVTDVVRDYGDPGLVEIAGDAQAMAAKLDLLMTRPREPWLVKVDRRLAHASWDRSWERMVGLLHRASPAVAQRAVAAAAAGAPVSRRTAPSGPGSGAPAHV
jgi:UDP-galactopyranose mutase